MRAAQRTGEISGDCRRGGAAAVCALTGSAGAVSPRSCCVLTT